MEDELNLDFDNIEANVEQNLKVKNRFKDLSEKVILTSKERDEFKTKADSAEQARVAAERDRDFYKGFNQISAKHPEAANYQDQILERVNKGYDAEEAALAILAKEGKLGNMPTQVQTPSGQVEGGSAATILEGNKSLSDMSVDDKFAALQELDTKGQLGNALRGR